jgi:exopolysaccharide biosynthesis WecB/TagA/CpsF family protein
MDAERDGGPPLVRVGDGAFLGVGDARPELAAGLEHPARSRARLTGIDFDLLAEAQVVRHILEAVKLGRGGRVVTPNVDICRLAAGDSRLRALVTGASLVVPDGMPLLWAGRLRGDPLVERVTGASLIFSLTEAAAREGRSIYLLGGKSGVPERAREELRRRYPGLIVAGAYAPPFGFDATPEGIESVRHRLASAAPDIVYVGLGFPKQDRLSGQLAPSFPAAWFIGCGAAISFAAGVHNRAPVWMQHAGLEWVFRLIAEPRRLFRRYMIHDVPFALTLLASSALQRFRPRGN